MEGSVPHPKIIGGVLTPATPPVAEPMKGSLIGDIPPIYHLAGSQVTPLHQSISRQNGRAGSMVPSDPRRVSVGSDHISIFSGPPKARRPTHVSGAVVITGLRSDPSAQSSCYVYSAHPPLAVPTWHVLPASLALAQLQANFCY